MKVMSQFLILLNLFSICEASKNSNMLLDNSYLNSIFAYNEYTDESENDFTEEDQTIEDSNFPLWMEINSEGVFESVNAAYPEANIDLKLGKRFDFAKPLDLYGKIKVTIGNPNAYWSNCANSGFGLRWWLANKAFSFTLFTEVAGGYYFATKNEESEMNQIVDKMQDSIVAYPFDFDKSTSSYYKYYKMGTSAYADSVINYNDSLLKVADSLINYADSMMQLYTAQNVRPLKKAREEQASNPKGLFGDFRIGFAFNYIWEQEDNGQLIKLWMDIYADLVAFHLLRRDQYNQDISISDAILYGNPKFGFSFNTPLGIFKPGIIGYGWIGVVSESMSNRIMGGPTLQWKPFESIDLTLHGDYLYGSYHKGIQRNTTFEGYRIGISFWYGLGL